MLRGPSTPPSRGGGGSEANTEFVPKMGLKFWALLIIFVFHLRNIFLM